MPAYTITAVAVTLGVTPKWLDNVLTRFQVHGVVQSRQGISRRLGHQAVITLHLANELIRTLGMPLGEAISLAERAGSTEGTAQLPLFSSASITIDLAGLSREVSQRLAQAVEVTPVPKRGRPPGK